MKTNQSRKSKNIRDQRGPTSAYMSGPIGQRVTARRGQDYMNSLGTGPKKGRVKVPKPKVK